MTDVKEAFHLRVMCQQLWMTTAVCCACACDGLGRAVKLPDQHEMWLNWRLTLKLSLPHYRQWVSTWSMPGWSTAWHSLQCHRRIWLLLSLLLLNRDEVSFQVACFYWHILFRFGGSGEQTLLQTCLPATKTQVLQPLTCSCVVRIIWQGLSPDVLFVLQLRDLLQLDFLFSNKKIMLWVFLETYV